MTIIDQALTEMVPGKEYLLIVDPEKCDLRRIAEGVTEDPGFTCHIIPIRGGQPLPQVVVDAIAEMRRPKPIAAGPIEHKGTAPEGGTCDALDCWCSATCGELVFSQSIDEEIRAKAEAFDWLEKNPSFAWRWAHHLKPNEPTDLLAAIRDAQNARAKEKA